jgi:hypothetical protein
VTAFPYQENQFSVNLARGWGAARPSYLKEKVFSLEGQRRMHDILFSGETAYDESAQAHLLGSQFGSGNFFGRINFRDIEKDFTTITNLPANQGEVGGNIFLNWNSEPLAIDTSLDLYRDRLFFNPDDPNAINRDFSTSFDVRVSPTDQWRTSLFYLDTPGEISPRQNVRAFTNYTKRFRLSETRDFTTTVGAGYQRSRFERLDISDYDRYSLSAGFRVPIIRDLTYYANYEYSFLDELNSNELLTPNVFTTGVNYYRQLSKSLSGTAGFSYRDEEDTESINSFLAGEDSVDGNIGLTYAPTNDLEAFVDGRVRNVWKENNENAAYNEIDVRWGVRTLWDLPFSWSPLGVVEGYVFKDLNGNRLHDGNEKGLADIPVHIGNEETRTNSQGHYHKEIRAKRVQVSVDIDDVPQGFIFSTDALKEVEIRQDKTTQVDFGLTTQSGIYGVVFYDKNGNGQPDLQDTFLPRIKITLDGKASTISDAEGAYFFSNISPGKHTLAIDVNSIPLEYIPTVKIKNEINLAEGTTYQFHIPLTKNPRPGE